MPEKYELFNLSDVGRKRKRNEDYFASFKKNGWLLLLLCDGMGGVKGGRQASRITVDTISQLFSSTKIEPTKFFNQAVAEANQAVLNRARLDDNLKGMGSTLVMVLFDGSRIFFAHVGDSRLYLLRANILQQLTRDHSYINEMIDRGIIETSRAQTHKFKNRITRCIGQNNSRPSICSEPIETQEGDQFLLCSDGLTDMLEDTEVEDILKKSENIELASRDLIEVANQKGGIDNITVQLLRITEMPRYGIRIGMMAEKSPAGIYTWIGILALALLISLLFGIPKINRRAPLRTGKSARINKETKQEWKYLQIGDNYRASSKHVAYNYFLTKGKILVLPGSGQTDTIISAGPPSMPVLKDCTLAFSETYLSVAGFLIDEVTDSLVQFTYKNNIQVDSLFSKQKQSSVLFTTPAEGHLLSVLDTIRLYLKHPKNHQGTILKEE